MAADGELAAELPIPSAVPVPASEDRELLSEE